jgi:type II secretory pathway component PulJ
MALSDAEVALIGAGIGAGGAVLTQIISSIVTGRRDARRFEWERDQAEKARSAEQARLHLESKRQACAQFLRLCSQRNDLLNRAWASYEPGQSEARARAEEESVSWWADVAELREELLLFDPGLRDVSSQVIGILAEWENDLIDEQDDSSSSSLSQKYYSVNRDLSDAMRRSLGLE